MPRSSPQRLGNDVRLHYLEQGDRAGRAVIMLHGLADSSFSFSRILPYLSGVHRILVPDLRGHGDSDRPSEGYRMGDMAADVLGFMDALGSSGRRWWDTRWAPSWPGGLRLWRPTGSRGWC